jgi:FtsZ-binding cell division protein ZapB
MKQDIEGILVKVENGMVSAADAYKLEEYITKLEMMVAGLDEENKRLMGILDSYLSKREELELEVKSLHEENDRLVGILQNWKKD